MLLNINPITGGWRRDKSYFFHAGVQNKLPRYAEGPIINLIYPHTNAIRSSRSTSGKWLNILHHSPRALGRSC